MDVIIRLLVLLGIFASAFILSQVLLGVAWRKRERIFAINRRLELIAEGGSRENVLAVLRKNAPAEALVLPAVLAVPYRAFQRMLFAAAVPLGAAQLLIAMTAAFVALYIVLLIAARFGGFGFSSGVAMLLAILAGSIAYLVPIAFLNMRAQRRRKRIEDQFPIALDVFVRAIRSGHPIASALEMLTHEMEDPIGSEFGLVADEVSYGAASPRSSRTSPTSSARALPCT